MRHLLLGVDVAVLAVELCVLLLAEDVAMLAELCVVISTDVTPDAG